MSGIESREVTPGNWRDVVRVEPREQQRRFVASVAYYLNLCHYGGVWRPLALYRGDQVVGFAMWGVDDADGSRWIGGLLIDAGYQGKGLGREATETLLDFLALNRDAARSRSPTSRRTRPLAGSTRASASSRPASGRTTRSSRGAG